MLSLVKKIADGYDPDYSQILELIRNRNAELQSALCLEAQKKAVSNYGNKVFLRGLIEISSYCKNDCFYCGIRRGNLKAERYRLSLDEILTCCEKGYKIGFRTFVLQGGEDSYYTDEKLCRLVSQIKSRYPDCAVTLSLGERSDAGYRSLYSAGVDRYLLRHETATRQHYDKLHPAEMSFDNRMRCLKSLREIGFQTGCGFMIGSPFQTDEDIVRDIIFIKNFRPHMVGIGPFIPHRNTPFAEYKSGNAELTVYLLSIIRILLPKVLLPATTALGTVNNDGIIRGILSGANVVMPNLSPEDAKRKYMLYDNKRSGDVSENIAEISEKLKKIGYEVSFARGDSLIK